MALFRSALLISFIAILLAGTLFGPPAGARRTGIADGYLIAQAEGEGADKDAAEDGEEKYLTRAEAARLLSATDFLKNKIGQLLSWSVGYDFTAVNRAKLVPTIKSISATPIRVPPDGRTVLSLIVTVDDPGGLGNISGVRADFSSIGQLPNMALVDNGLWGDEKAGDGIYTIQTSVKTTVDLGKKDIPVAVANNSGWLALSRTSLDVEKDPRILWVRATPQTVREGSEVLFEVAVENPGRMEDIKSVTIDLGSVGGAVSEMKNDGKDADSKAGDNIFTLRYSVPRNIPSGEKTVKITVQNVMGGQSPTDIMLNITR